MTERWQTRRHGPLTRLEDGLYVVEAELESAPIGRRMTIFRLSDGSLALHSVIACDEATMAAIEALGELRYLLVPSALHTMDAPAYVARYPSLEVLTTAASRPKVEPRVAVRGEFSRLPGDPRLRHEVLEGAPLEAVFVHTSPEGAVSLVFNDVLMNLPDRLPGFKGWLTKLMGSTGGPKVTKIARRFLVEDPAQLAAQFEHLAAIPGLRRLVVGHGALVEVDAAGVLQSVAATLR